MRTQSLAQSPVSSTHMHSQVVSMTFVTTVVSYVAAAAPFNQETLGRRAAKLSSVTEPIYIFFAIGSMCFLPASGLLNPPFAPARRAHPATGRLCSLSSLQMLHTAVAAAACSRPALSSISWPMALERCQQRFWVEKFGACGGPRTTMGGRCMALLALSVDFTLQ